MPTNPVIPKRSATPLHELNLSKLEEVLKFTKRCQRRAPSKRFMGFLEELKHTYEQCLLYEEVVNRMEPGDTPSERQWQDNEMRKRKVYSSEKMLESRADSLNELNQRLIHVLRDLFELELLTKVSEFSVLHQKYVTNVIELLDKESFKLQEWEKNSSTLLYPDQTYSVQIKKLALDMGVEEEVLVFRLRVYANRNTFAHSGDLNQHIEKGQFAAVARTLVEDFARLEEVLLKADRQHERVYWEDALRTFASLYFENFNFKDSETIVLTKAANEKAALLLKEAANAERKAAAKAQEQESLRLKHEEGFKKQRRQTIRESSAKYRFNAAEGMERYFQDHPDHELADSYTTQMQHYEKLEKDQMSKEMWKQRAEVALGLLERFKNVRLDWEEVVDEYEKVKEEEEEEEEEESVPFDFGAMGLE